MFSQNNKLSPTGTFKLIVTDFLAPVILFSLYMAGSVSLLEGMIVLTVCYVLSCLYLKFMLYTDIKRGIIISIFIIIKSLLLCTFSTLLLTKSIHEMLLPDTNVGFIAFAILLASLILSRKNIEIRGRLCELLYLFVIIPVAISLVYGLFHIDYLHMFEYLLDFSEENISRMILLSIGGFLFLCPAEFLKSDENFYYNEKASKNIFLKSALFLYVIGMVQFVVASLTYNLDSPLFIIISLLLYSSGCLYHGDRAIFSILHLHKNAVVYLYGIVSYLLVLLFLFAPFGLNYSGSEDFIDARELEDRTFVNSMIIDYNDTLSMVCETTDYTAESVKSKYIYLTASEDTLKKDNPINALLESYPLEGGKIFDFSHIEAMVVNISGGDVNKHMKEFYYMTTKYRLPSDTLVFKEKDFPGTYSTLTDQLESISFGKVLKTLAENQGITKQKTLRAFTFDMQ